MSRLMVERRFLAEYARTPVNLLALVVVPAVFVVVVTGPLSRAAEVLGAPDPSGVATVSAGWTAGFLTGIAMYFHIATTRAADRALVIAGMRPWRVVTARLATGAALAVVGSLAALLALGSRDLSSVTARAIVGTFLFAGVYLGIGAVAGAVAPDPVNGTATILVIWILDAFFGPVLSDSGQRVTRVLPTHDISVWMAQLPVGHISSGRALALGAGWALTALVAAVAVLCLRVRQHGARASQSRSGGLVVQVRAATLAAVRASRRDPVLWVLLAVVPAVFVVFAQLTTPHSPTSVTVTDAGVTGPRMFDVFDIHAGTMTPIAVASLAALAGVFALVDSRAGDARLVVAGMRPIAALAARVGVLLAAATLAAGVTLAVSAPFFQAAQWPWFAISVLLIALTYALLGALVAPLVGRVAAVLLAFLVPFLDLGIGQSPMLASQPAGWAHWLPSYPAYRLLIDSGLSREFDSTWEVFAAVAWIAVLAIVLTFVSRAGRELAGGGESRT